MPAEGTRRSACYRRTDRRCGFLLEMMITVNGKPMEVDEGTTIRALLERLGVRGEFTAVALNLEVARKASYDTTILHEGDRVEIVHPVGGG